MTTQGMQGVVGKMVVSDLFRGKVLFAREFVLFNSFDVTPDEVEVLMSIQAETLPDFALGVTRYIDLMEQIGLVKPVGAEKE